MNAVARRWSIARQSCSPVLVTFARVLMAALIRNASGAGNHASSNAMPWSRGRTSTRCSLNASVWASSAVLGAETATARARDRLNAAMDCPPAFASTRVCTSAHSLVGQRHHGVAEFLRLPRMQLAGLQQRDRVGEPADELVGVQQPVLRGRRPNPQDQRDLFRYPVPVAVRRGIRRQRPAASGESRRAGWLVPRRGSPPTRGPAGPPTGPRRVQGRRARPASPSAPPRRSYVR